MGGLDRRKNRSAPQMNMIIESTNGMIVHVSSRTSDPWMSAPTSSG